MAAENTANPPAPNTIILIHGMWMTPLSWEHWIDRFETRGWAAYCGFSSDFAVHPFCEVGGHYRGRGTSPKGAEDFLRLGKHRRINDGDTVSFRTYAERESANLKA